MPVDVFWLVENRVVMARGSGEVTAEENQESDRQVLALLDVGTAPVHVIMDVTRVETFPFSTLNQRKDSTQQFTEHPNLGWGVLCGSVNPLVRFMAGVITRLTRVHFRMFETLDEGVRFLKEQDHDLDWDAIDFNAPAKK